MSAEPDNYDTAPTTRHVLEVAVAPYTPANPRRYYAADYQNGDFVINGGVTYIVRDIAGQRVFLEAQ